MVAADESCSQGCTIGWCQCYEPTFTCNEDAASGYGECQLAGWLIAVIVIACVLFVAGVCGCLFCCGCCCFANCSPRYQYLNGAHPKYRNPTNEEPVAVSMMAVTQPVAMMAPAPTMVVATAAPMA
eukprot:1852630-Pyramimonas_sp.AAC.1